MGHLPQAKNGFTAHQFAFLEDLLEPKTSSIGTACVVAFGDLNRVFEEPPAEGKAESKSRVEEYWYETRKQTSRLFSEAARCDKKHDIENHWGCMGYVYQQPEPQQLDERPRFRVRKIYEGDRTKDGTAAADTEWTSDHAAMFVVVEKYSQDAGNAAGTATFLGVSDTQSTEVSSYVDTLLANAMGRLAI